MIRCFIATTLNIVVGVALGLLFGKFKHLFEIKVVNAHDGKIISTKESLHIRSITAMALFLPMRYLITASKEGSSKNKTGGFWFVFAWKIFFGFLVKVWDMNWSLKIVFVGHNDCVLSLAVHPFAPYVISSSADRTMRVWSLDQQDIVDK
jgi:WD40 repeat protein